MHYKDELFCSVSVSPDVTPEDVAKMDDLMFTSFEEINDNSSLNTCGSPLANRNRRPFLAVHKICLAGINSGRSRTQTTTGTSDKLHILQRPLGDVAKPDIRLSPDPLAKVRNGPSRSV